MRELVKYPALSLFQKAQEVTEFNAELHSFLDEMKQIMAQEQGIGLAANQTGSNHRLFIMQLQPRFKTSQPEIIEVINPKILDWSATFQRLSEGCLSAPGIYLTIPRHEEIHVQYQDRYGNIKEGVLTGIEAVCFQHENDHLDGVFFLDKASRNERRAALRTMGLK
jgi:peptide deformylase